MRPPETNTGVSTIDIAPDGDPQFCSPVGRFVIITLEPAANVSNAQIRGELRQRLQSQSFSVSKIAILEGGKIDTE